MKLQKYLDRIGFDDEAKPDVNTLFDLHRRHLLSIPYENLDVQLKRRVDLDIERIYEKIVIGGRGGWCYELNGIFGWALQEVGFDVTRMGGAVAREFRGGDDFFGSHLVLDVIADDEHWLCDVGFGDALFEPVRFVEGPFTQRGFKFELLRDGKYWRLRNHEFGGAPSFDFAMAPIAESTLETTCDWLSTDPSSMFTRWLVVQQFTLTGYEQQTGLTARSISVDGKIEWTLESSEDLLARLRDTFALDVPEVADLWDQLSHRHEQHLAEQVSS